MERVVNTGIGGAGVPIPGNVQKNLWMWHHSGGDSTAAALLASSGDIKAISQPFLFFLSQLMRIIGQLDAPWRFHAVLLPLKSFFSQIKQGGGAGGG